ncbi:hypothetical protein BU15DRAFT_51588, partial [Melanogaster broomeanus]
ESKQTRKVLYTAFDRLERETKRADAAESRIEEMIQRVTAINDGRLAAQQEAVRANEELRLYKLQLENAQKEILRAQDVLKAIEYQRDEAEAAGAAARTEARRLTEARLVQLAREEGRRLGFEEGIRRGRRMGYQEGHSTGLDDGRSEMRDVATVTLDRLLEDTEEQVGVLDYPSPLPPSAVSRTAPNVHRVETSVHSSRGNERHSSRSRRDSSDTISRASSLRHVPEHVVLPTTTAPWPAPPTGPPFSRPVSVHNSPPSVRHAEIRVPPEGYIPTADNHHDISLPPPHELHRNIPSPTPSQQTTGPPDRGRTRDYTYDNFPPPRRGSPDDSLTSAKQSATSTISLLEIVGLPSNSKRRDRSQGLSVIHEDASMRSERMTERSQTAASTSQAERHSVRTMGSSETLRQDRNAKQQLADELRYSNPSEPEAWRHYAAQRVCFQRILLVDVAYSWFVYLSWTQSNSQASSSGPPRHRPFNVTVPTPLSPPRGVQQMEPSRHRRTQSMSERQGRAETRSQYGEDHRRPLSSDSSVPEINVEPPVTTFHTLTLLRIH